MKKIYNFQFTIFNLISHPLFAGSFIMIAGNLLVNFENYIYHLILGRLLGPANYSVLAAVIALIGLLGILPLSFGLVIVKFVSAAKTKEEVASLAQWLTRKLFVFGGFYTLVIILAAPALARFLQVKDLSAVLLVGPFLFATLLTFLNRSVLQGLLRFAEHIASLLLEVGIKLVGGVVLVVLGFSVSWAIGAIVLGAIAAFFLTRFFLREYFAKPAKKIPKIKPLILYSIPVFIQTLASTSIFSTDLILVKHFFQPHDAGIYAAASTLGRIIFFAAAPVGAVMFPMVSGRQARGHPYKKIFWLALFLTAAIAAGISFFYLIFPKLAINILYGSAFLEARSLVFLFGVFMSLFTLAVFLVSFHLSVGQISVVVLPLLASIGQAVGIWFYHDSLGTVIKVSLIVTGLLLGSLLLYFGYAQGKKDTG